MEKAIEEVQKKILPILQSYHVKKAGLFGSFARQEQRQDSDIDILVEMDNQISLLYFIRMKLQIEEVLGQKIDLVEYNSIKPLLKERILREEVVIT